MTEAQQPEPDLTGLVEAIGVRYELDLATGALTLPGARLERLDPALAEVDATALRWDALVHPLDREPVHAALARSSSTSPADVEHRLQVAGRAVAVRNLARRGADGRVVGVLLTAEPRAGRVGAPPRDVLEGALGALPLPVIVKDDAQVALFVNDALCQMLGHPRERLLGRGFEQVLSRGSIAAFAAHDREALADGRAVAASVSLSDAEGETRDLACLKAAFHDARARRYVVGVAHHDLSVRSHVERERERGREFLEHLLDTVGDPIFVKDDRHRWIAFNRAFEQLIGHPRQVLLGRSDFDFFPPDEAEVFWTKDELVLRTGEVNENEESFTDARGRRHTILTKKTAFTAPDGRRVLVGVIRDITERRAAEQALRESEERFRTIFNQGPLGMAILDLDLRVRRINDMLCRMLEADDARLVGRRLVDLTHPDDRTSSDTAAHLLSGELTSRKSERRFLRGDGGVLWGSLTLSLINDAEGEPLHFVAMLEDVGERKRAEEALLQARDAALRSAQAKSRFLANVSHEIRTPLNAVIGLTGLLLDGELEPEQRESVELIRSSGDALLTLLNDVLDFSKLESDRMELERRPFDLRVCVEESLDLVAPRAVEKGLELTFLSGAGVPRWVGGDSTRLRQVLVNLLSNAVKFTARGEVRLDVSAGADLHFAVVDTGIGIPPERLDRLFQSFSQVDASTTRQFGGTGLGLAISRSLVERMGGRMWVESAPGRGSTFHFTLPLVTRPSPAAAPAPDEGVDPVLAGRRLLVVDDVASVRELVARSAGSWGMVVVGAADLEEALARVRAGEAFDVILVDRELPGDVSAADAARALGQVLGDATPPLVLLTHMGRAGSKRLRGLFAAQLSKPLKLDPLRALLVRLVTGERDRALGDRRIDPTLGQRVPLRILVVDDNAVNLRVAQRLLERMGYRADLAGSGPEALAALQRQPYDVVLLDVQMPEMDGFEVARRVRALEAGAPGRRRPRLVALTADVLHGDRERCLAAGMDDFVGKPVRIEELAGALLRTNDPAGDATGDPGALATSAAIDEDVVRGLGVLSDPGDESPIAELYAVLLADVPAQLRSMRDALARHDATTLTRLAHGLRGGSANLGARLLQAAAARVEEAARDGAAALLPALLEQVEAALERTREAAARRFPRGRLDADPTTAPPPVA